jgi:hypothetical protein
MAWREAHHAADARFRFRHKEPLVSNVQTSIRNIRLEGCKVVVENKSARVRRITYATGPSVAWAQVATRIVGGGGFDRDLFYRPLPRPLGTLRRYHDPLIGERVEPAMWIFVKSQRNSLHTKI